MEGAIETETEAEAQRGRMVDTEEKGMIVSREERGVLQIAIDCYFIKIIDVVLEYTNTCPLQIIKYK